MIIIWLVESSCIRSGVLLRESWEELLEGLLRPLTEAWRTVEGWTKDWRAVVWRAVVHCLGEFADTWVGFHVLGLEVVHTALEIRTVKGADVIL